MGISAIYAEDEKTISDIVKYFGKDPLSSMVTDYESLSINLKKYMNMSDIDEDVVKAVGDKLLGKINSNRNYQGLPKLQNITTKPKLTMQVKVKPYYKGKNKIQGYEKSAPRRFNKTEEAFIKERRNLSIDDLTNRFNSVFDPRTKSSLKTKRSRLK